MFDPTRRAAGQLMLAAPVVFALAPADAGAREARSATITGRNVTSVQTQSALFALRPMRRWSEMTSGGAPAFDFAEVARDEHSVYLHDESRGVRLQIDLARALVLYADEGAPQMRPLYPITGSSAAVNGGNVIFARVPSGRYLMTGPRTWVERGNDGVEFTFAEQSRDEWSVHLADDSRQIRLEVDVRGKRILYGDFAAPDVRPLYPITAVTAITA